MWPWGHLAAGYLVYRTWSYGHNDTAPAGIATVALVVGTQFPDLVDKPLAWTFSISPSGRAGAHSLLVALPFLAVLRMLVGDRENLWGGFAVGYLVHLVTDGLYPALDGELVDLSYLLWPVTSIPVYEESESILAHFAAMELTTPLLFECGLFVLAVVLWVSDGAPGFPGLVRLLTEGSGPQTREK